MFSLFFIRRPIVAMVISIVILIVGGLAMRILPIAQFPQIVPPTVQVSAFYPGGSAETVEKSVTSVLEEQLNGTEGMLYMESTSASDGTATIKLYFDLGRDLDLAAVDVQNRLSAALPSLPPEVKQRGVTTKKLASSILEIVSVTSDNPKHDALFLSNFAALNLVDELKRVEGVSNVVILGEHRYAMRIWLQPDRMAALGVSVDEIAGAIRSQNLQVALGTIGETSLKRQSRYQYTLIAQTRLDSPESFGQIVIRQQTDGANIRLKDVARIELGSESYLSSGFMDNKEAAALAIYPLPDANALEVADGIQKKIDALKRRFPKGIKVAPSYDTTKFVRISIDEVIQTLIEALVLVLVVVYLFLQSLRATLIPAIAIPVSLIGTFAAMWMAGFSINTLTLFGLILAIGIVVDDAILVVENVEANLEKDPSLSVKEATTKAMQEIFAPVISTTLVLMAVFVPVAFIPGISGALYRQFALTIAFSVFISAIVALSLSPALAAKILRRGTGEKNLFFRAFDRFLERVKKGYRAILARLIAWRYGVLALFGVLLVATVWIFKTLPTGFLPDEDQGSIIATVTMQPGTRLHDLEAVTRRITDIIQKTPGIERVVTVNGYNGLTGVVDSSTASYFIMLKDWDERTTPQLSVTGLIADLQKRVNTQVPQARTLFFNTPSIPGISAVGGFEFKLLNLSSMPMKRFETVARDFIAKLQADPRIASAYTMFRADYPQLFVDIDRDKVAAMGVRLSDLFATLQSYLGTYYVNDFNKFGKTYRVYLQADPAYRTNKNDISSFYVRNAQAEMVPLSSLVHLHNTLGANAVTHFDAYQSIAVNGLHNAKDGYSSADALTAIEELAQKYLPKDVGYAFSGISLQEKEAGNAALSIFMLSFLMVYLFLAAQYESWVMPLMVMLPIPAVMFGALGANMMAGLLNDIYTQIGLVLLIGMAGKNAILIVEFAKELHEKGMAIVESAIEASVLRLRAILMTALAFLLGILPLVVATGAGAASRRSLGTAVFGGMALSVVLTLFLTPVLFVVFQRLIDRFKRGEEVADA